MSRLKTLALTAPAGRGSISGRARSVGGLLGKMLFAFVLGSAILLAQRPTTVNELVSFMTDTIKRKEDDRLVADYLAKNIKMKERLDEKTIETLEGMGAGPRTVAALKKLASAAADTQSAPEAAAPTPIAPPSAMEQAAILDTIRQNALNYTKGLPDYLCTQMTRRNVDSTGTGNHWKQTDVIQEQLSFVDHQEKYVVIAVNGQIVNNREHRKLGGATSEGEFGTMLYDIFDPESETEFQWERWATWRGRRTHVYSFQVLRERSRYDIYYGPTDRHVISAYKGLVYADAANKTVMRIVMQCVDLPPDFPIQEVSQELRYAMAKIADQEFLLPERSELNSRRENRYLVNNVTTFHLYRKFSADDKIIYDQIPDDKTKEEPEKPPVKKQP